MRAFGKRSERAGGTPEFIRGERVPFSTDGELGSIACVFDSAELSLVLSLASKKEQIRNGELLCPQECI